MNKSELIAALGTKFYKVDEAGIHEGNTEAGITVFTDRANTFIASKIADSTIKFGYIETRTPNDWPKAAPEEGQVGAGRGGV